MPGIDRLRRAASWAAEHLGSGTHRWTNVRVMPWSASARLTTDSGRHWLKVSVPANNAAEASVLRLATTLGLPEVPRLVGECRELNAILLEHVVSLPGPTYGPAAHAARDRACRRLSLHAASLSLPTLTASGCGETITSACLRGGPGWLDDDLAGRLGRGVARCADALALLDLRNGGRHGVVHGDFHPGNVLGSRAGPMCIDWADSALGAPGWDRSTWQMSTDPAAAHNAATAAMAHLKGLADLLATPVPSSGAELSLPLPQLHRHISLRAVAAIQSMSVLATTQLRSEVPR